MTLDLTKSFYGLQSLNILGICDIKLFMKMNVVSQVSATVIMGQKKNGQQCYCTCQLPFTLFLINTYFKVKFFLNR